jgi:hypothetical protein
MPSPVIHQRLPVTHDVQVKNILGVTTSASVNTTARSTCGTPLFVTTTHTSGSQHNIKTYSYSYDGVLHVDSFVSDI